MPKITVGTVTIVLPENITMDPRAGKLSNEEQRKLLKPPKGLGQVCDETAADMEKYTGQFVVPGVNAKSLRKKGDMADTFDQVMADVKMASRIIMQGNLLADADAFNDLRRVNNQVKAQVDFEPAVKRRFSSVVNYFLYNKKRKGKRSEDKTEGLSETPDSPLASEKTEGIRYE